MVKRITALGMVAIFSIMLLFFGNLNATGEVSQMESPNTVLITDCESGGVAGSKTEDSKGSWSRLPLGQPIELQPDVRLDSGDAITVTATTGTLRLLSYDLRSALDTREYEELGWDMRVFKEGDGDFSTWEDICDIYGPSIGVRIGSSESDYYTYDLSRMTVTPIKGKPTCYRVSLEIEDTTSRAGSFDRSKMSSFNFYTNPDGPPVGEVNSVLRIDNLAISKGFDDGGNGIDDGNGNVDDNGGQPAVDETFTWEIGSGTYYKADASNIQYEIREFSIDASAASFEDLALTLSIYVDNLDEPGNISGFTRNNSEGQIELTSSGGPDSKEFNWSLPKQGLRPGWNQLRLPLKAATLVGGGADISSLNYFRLYNLVPNENTTVFEVRIEDVRLTNEQEKVHLPSFFSDGMIFQQNKPMNIWGKTEYAGETITARLMKDNEAIEVQTVQSDENGEWGFSFTARDGGYDSYSIAIEENDTLVEEISDILIGELWLASGQSNMEFPVYQSVGGDELVSQARDEYLRFMMEPPIPAGRNEDQPYSPQYDVPGTRWGYGDIAGDVSNVSALAYNMALELRNELDVPVGFINSALGATVIESWMSRESINGNTRVKQELENRGIYKTEETFNIGADKWNQMTAMYNAKIAPLQGMNIGGVVWYQGESNAKYAYGYYDEALTALVKDWSEKFGFKEGQMPFIFAHLAPHNYTNNMPFDYLAYFAEMQSKAWSAQPGKMVQITLYDLPLKYSDPPVAGAHPIHPSDKAPLGKRFAEAALSQVYGKGDEGYTAPVFESISLEGNKIVINFAETGKGLEINGASKDLHGFAICSSDRVFVGARAKITSPNTVEVWSEGVQDPLAVTYGFSTFNMAANLINSFGLPAVPFRSDTVDSSYYGPNDWTYCDDGEIWVSTVSPIGAGYEPMWLSGPIDENDNIGLEFDTVNKVEGKAALKVSYIPTADGLAGVGPVLNYPTMDNKFALYNYLTLSVMNPDQGAKQLELVFRTDDGKLYKATKPDSELTTVHDI
ncbi:MAG TPA: sialate O-acetylesterase, partial [Bacillota bacterium]|nr:sialate O-acetylesterase [Bacillota bacterium]